MTRRPPAEVDIDDELVQSLVADQFPQWAGLPLRAVDSSGWDNAIYRLGSELAVRLPRRQIAAEHARREQEWLPLLAGHLPLATPVVVGRGRPGAGYPWVWSVVPWLPGEVAEPSLDLDWTAAALKLADFITALQATDATGGPISDFRHDLADGDRQVADALNALGDVPFRDEALTAWHQARAAAPWNGPAVWMHGDLHPANLLATGTQLSGVLDFGLLAAGDPAVDLMVAWTFLPQSARHVFRCAVQAGEATWERSCGWALLHGLRCCAHSEDSPLLGRIGRYTVSQVIADESDRDNSV